MLEVGKYYQSTQPGHECVLLLRRLMSDGMVIVFRSHGAGAMVKLSDLEPYLTLTTRDEFVMACGRYYLTTLNAED